MKKKKKSKKKRNKTISNKDSYSYYTESVHGITNQSEVIKEDMEEDEEVAQIEIMEIGSPKLNPNLLGFTKEPDSKQSSPSVTDCQKPGSFVLQMQPTEGFETIGRAMFNASPVGRSPRNDDQEETK